MCNLQITIPGECPIKKNSAKHQSFIWDKKRKMKVPLPYNLVYYTKEYKDWAKNAIIHLHNFKEFATREYQITFPLTGSYFVSFWIFRSRSDSLSESRGRVDLTNLIEAPQDLLSGRVGNFLDTKSKKFDHSYYQILEDDNSKVIVNLGTSKVFYDPVPRVVIYIAPFSMEKYLEMHKLLYSEKSE